MIPAGNKKKSTVKKIMLAALALLLFGGGLAWYFLTKGFDDTAEIKADYTVSAKAFMDEFKLNDKLNEAANKKYAEKIITVNGRVSSVEAADTTLNLKIENTDGAYIAFAFQQKDQAAVKNVKAGDSVSIKGSCNGAGFSSILGVPYITFKRCSLNK
jgi:flagellar basal body-associated protein FliL